MWRLVLIATLLTACTADRAAAGACSPAPSRMLGAPAPAVSAPEPGQAVVRTRVGAFVVRTKVAGELERALFGEPTQHQFYAGSD